MFDDLAINYNSLSQNLQGRAKRNKLSETLNLDSQFPSDCARNIFDLGQIDK
jgi:hypothetical protein